MRKLKLSMQMTINGYVGGPNGENDWMTWSPDAEFLAFLISQFESSSTLLIGRKLAENFIQFWETTAEKSPDNLLAQKIVAMQKVVFSKKLKESTWNNTTLAKGDLAEEVANLKKQDGKDIIVLGGANFVSSLIKEELFDEYHLIVNPTAIGSGLTIFNSIGSLRKFTPIQSKLYPGGKIVVNFKPKND